MALAARPERRGAAPHETELDRLLAEGRAYSGEFPFFLANHLPMMLVAMQRLGGSDERLAEFFTVYRDVHRLAPLPVAQARIERADWSSALGDRSRESDYRAYFREEVARLGNRTAIAAYLPTLLPGIAASATHGLMRLAYGVLRNDPAEIGAALGYWSATYLELGRATGAPPITDDPGAVLLRLQAMPAFRQVETERDLLWHFMRAVAAKPEFGGLVDWLRIGPDTERRVAAASLALYAGTMDFCALHAVTGAHWIRLITPVAPDPDLALRYFWQAIASLYPKIGFPDLPSAEMLDEWRRADCPEWPEIKEAAVGSNDEHDLSLVFSAHEEWKVYGDRLYQVVAARRMQLIP
jgi:hypothetical protein